MKEMESGFILLPGFLEQGRVIIGHGRDGHGRGKVRGI